MRGRPLIVAVLAALVSAAPAGASRVPTKTEAAAIKTALTAFIKKPNSPAAKNNRIVKIRIASSDKTWASAETFAPNVGGAFALLRLKAGTWQVIGFGTGGFECGKDGPKKVLQDLFDGCIPS